MTDLADDELAALLSTDDPYRALGDLVAADRPHWSDALGGWLIAGYQDVRQAHLDTGLFSSERPLAGFLDVFAPAQRAELAGLERHLAKPGIVHADPPGHNRLRQALRTAFTAKVVEQLRPTISDLVTRHLDRVAQRGEMEVIADLAAPLPAAVIAGLLGAPEADAAQFVQWSHEVFSLYGGTPDLPRALDAQHGYQALEDYMMRLADRRRARPRNLLGRDDLLTTLVGALDAGELTADEVASTCTALLIAGHETTTSLISSTVLLLLQHPDQLALVREQPDLLGGAIEETLRYESPVKFSPRRITGDADWGGAHLRAGQTAFLMLAAANRDPREFPDPDRFDILRTSNRHVGFGFGVHLCLGAPLARIEASIAIAQILDRWPGLRLAGDDLRWSTSRPMARCLERLRVTF